MIMRIIMADNEQYEGTNTDTEQPVVNSRASLHAEILQFDKEP